jgi:DNA sulfur modification protein DndD
LKLRSLELQNFRQFYGTSTIEFSTGRDKNITVIFGANGAGKTALLNAFLWVLYKGTTVGFERPENLANDRAVSETKPGGEIDVKVTLEFEHEDSVFYAVRQAAYKRSGKGLETEVVLDGIAQVQVKGPDGKTTALGNPDEALSRVLPERLHSFFFFDGERIEALGKDVSYEDIQNAIKSLLGLEIVERAQQHLTTGVAKSLTTKLREFASAEVTTYIEAKDAIDEKKRKKEEEKTLENANLLALRKELNEVQAKLRLLNESRELQERLDALGVVEGNLRRDLRAEIESLSSVISSRGFLGLGSGLAAKCAEIIQEKRRRKELPSGIKRQFVTDLLADGKCICGTPLVGGSPAHVHVSDWLTRAGLDDVEEWATVLGGLAGEIVDSAPLLEEIRRRQAQTERLNGDLRKNGEEQSEAQEKLGKHEREDVRRLGQREEELGAQIERKLFSLGEIQNEITALGDKSAEYGKSIAEATAKGSQEALIKRRLVAVQQAVDFFAELYRLRSLAVRQELDRDLKGIYSQIVYKDYIPELTPDYHLMLHKTRVGGVEDNSTLVAKSTGENQVLSLSFIASVAHYARERWDAYRKDPNRVMGFPGGIYPMVMDSPFGSLDPNYRKPVAEILPTLAPQVVVMVSKSQGLGDVEQGLGTRIGKAYVLHYHTSKKDVKPEFLQFRGKRLPYITPSAKPVEWAEVLEIP